MRPAGPAAGSGPSSTPAPPANLDACVRRLGTKGFATTASLAEALLSTPEAVQPLLDQLVVDGVAASVAGAYRLTEAGSERAATFVAADREAWGVEAATAALDAFLALDHRMKAVVTDWQLRPGDGEPQVNDHSDAGVRRRGARPAGRPPRGRGGLARPARARDPAPGRLPGAPRPGRRAGDCAATASTSPRRASTATTASGSSSTRT